MEKLKNIFSMEKLKKVLLKIFNQKSNIFTLKK